jgi:glycosyltransferase involved in cell wall biosynthesis
MHVAIVTHNVLIGDGQGRVNFELTRHLLDEGVSVDLIADAVDPRLLDWGARWIPVHPRVPGVDASLDRLLLAKVWRFHQMANRVVAAREDEYDLVMGCGHTLSRPHTVNAVHFVHGAWLQSPSHPFRSAGWSLGAAYQGLFSHMNARWEITSLRQAEHIVAVSDKVRDELRALGLPGDRIETVVNGVDTEEFRPGPADRTALQLPADVPLALFAGDIRSTRKNLDTVLRALPQVPSLHLAVAGSLEGSPYPALAEALGLSDRVHFLGFRRDMPALMRAADVFTFPSRYEACTLALLEALASGLPVVTARSTGGSELITEACGAVLDDPDDQSALAEALNTMLAHPDRHAAMGRAARAVAEAHSWRRMGQRYLSLFRRAVQAPSRPRPAVPARP